MTAQIVSDNGKWLATQQGDGNFVVYPVMPDGTLGEAVWSSWVAEANTQAPTQPSPTPVIVTLSLGGLRVIQVSGAQDGEVINRGYSYYPSAWVAPDGLVYLFAGMRGGRVHLFQVDPRSGEVTGRQPLTAFRGEAEGWYWDAAGWIYLCDGPALHHYNPFTGEDRVIFDIRLIHPGCDLWQAHSSDDGWTHSATVRRTTCDGSTYPKIGTVVFRHGKPLFQRTATGELDESQITANGSWLIIKEDNDNRVISLYTGEERRITNAEGALGHSDVGPDFVVGEDDIIGVCVRWDLPTRTKTLLFSTWNMGHVSIRGGRCLLSDGTWLSLVPLTGGPPVPVCEHGMVSDGTYDTQVHGTLSPCGRVASFMSNKNGLMNLYLLVMP